MAITLTLGDITACDTDAIVNAANPHLLPGGGVCGAIHRAAGPELAAACMKWVLERGPVATGAAAITPGFRLAARYVVHAVGPVWHGGEAGEPEALAKAYRSAVACADEYELTSIAFPSISTGIFGYPVRQAAPLALRAVREAVAEATSVADVVFVLFDHDTREAFESALALQVAE